MLTKLEEKGLQGTSKRKAEKYWPELNQPSLVFPRSDIRVEQLPHKRSEQGGYVYRKFLLTRGSKSGTIVHQLQATAWPDHSVPESPRLVLELVSEAAMLSPGLTAPILVHCSAGVGRSGTLIAIDSLSQAMEEEGSVSIFQTVSDLRIQRNYLVQSVKQYQFVYRAIMEWSQFGDTEMDCAQIKEHWLSLAKEKESLKAEFSRLANVVDDRKVILIIS